MRSINRLPALFPYEIACKVTVVDLIERTKWCNQNIGDWLVNWTHVYDPEYKVYWYLFSTEEDLTLFKLIWS